MEFQSTTAQPVTRAAHVREFYLELIPGGSQIEALFVPATGEPLSRRCRMMDRPHLAGEAADFASRAGICLGGAVVAEGEESEVLGIAGLPVLEALAVLAERYAALEAEG